MNNLQSILSHISDTLQDLSECHHLEEFVGEFYSMWIKLGNYVQQSLFQAKIEKKEAEYDHPRTKREKRYYTPLGEMVLVRRAYVTGDGIKVLVDEELGLPKDKWLPMVLELACALGVSSEFPNSHSLFQKWTTLNLTQKTLANQVEKVGNQLQNQEFQVECDIDLSSQLPTDNLKSEPADLL